MCFSAKSVDRKVFCYFRMDRKQACRHFHALPRNGERLHHEDQHVGCHSGHGEPHGHRKPSRNGR